MSIRITDPLIILFRVAQLPLFCVVFFVLWTKFLRPTRGDQHDIEIASRRMLKQADRMCKKHQLVRNRSETLNQFAARIETFCDTENTNLGETESERLRTLPTWYREFATARYQGLRPAPIT